MHFSITSVQIRIYYISIYNFPNRLDYTAT
jgi:hypothetical protein